MISGKDITIDKDGSIILNGDKHPLASQAEIDAVKDDIDVINTALEATEYKAGDTISADNVVASAYGASSSECYFSVPLSKPVSASSVSISSVSCNVFYGENQKTQVGGAIYTGTIKAGSILVKITREGAFTENSRYIVDFTGTFTFS